MKKNKKSKLGLQGNAAPVTARTIIGSNTDFSVVEGYKAARTNIMFTCGQETCPVILFTSAFMGEGKTISCVNMAVTFAQAGFRTLIIDADMRKPQMYRLFGLDLAPGLSDILAGFSGKGSIHSTSYENLSVLTSGTVLPNPAELMTSKTMDQLLTTLRSQYDYIFIDSPPVLLVTDAAALANRVTGTILIVRQMYSRTNDLTECVLSLQMVGANIIGIILNDFNTNERTYYKHGYKRGYAYSHYSYGRYGGYEHKAEETPVER